MKNARETVDVERAVERRLEVIDKQLWEQAEKIVERQQEDDFEERVSNVYDRLREEATARIEEEKEDSEE